MAGTFDGSIFADIGANTKDYEQAMARIVSTTQQAFLKAQDSAVNSSNRMIQRVGQIMAQLANNGQSLGQRLGNAYTTGLNLSLGKIQSIASKIGEKIPEPIKAGFAKISGPINNVISQLSSKLTDFANKTRMQLQNAFDISKVRTAFANAANSVDGFTQKVSGKLQGLVGIFAKTADRLPGPFGAVFGKIASSVSVLDSKFQSVGQKLAMSLGRQVLNPALQSWSSFFGTLTSKANATADKISNSFGGRIVSSVAKLSTKIGSTLSGSFSNLSSRAASALNGINQRFSGASSAGQKLASTVRSIVSAFSLMAIAQKAINALTSSLGAAVDRVDTMNRFPKTMSLFGYSAEQSKGAIDKLSKGIEGLPTTLDSAVASAQQLTITTGNLDRGTDLALAFNNAMVGYGATTEGAKDALRQFNQALGAGRFQAEEFNSVAEAAPGLMNKMASAFGKSNVPEFKKALSEGEITMDQFADKMIELNEVQGGFAEMAQTSAGGIRTAMGNVKNAVVRGVADMISKFDEAAKANGMKTIAENLLALKSNILSAFDTVNSIIPNLVAAFARLKSMVNIDTSGFGKSLKAGFDLLNTALGEFAQKGELTQATIDKIKAKIGEIGPKAVTAWALLNPASVIKTMLPLVSVIGKVGGVLVEVGLTAGAFASVLGGAFSSVGGLIGVLAARITGLTGVFGNAAARGMSILGSMVSAMGSVMSLALSAIGPAAILGLVLVGLGLVNQQFGAQIDQLINTVTTKGPQIIQNLVTGITSKIPALIASGADLVAKFANAFAVMFPVLVQAGVDLISSLVSGVGQNAGSLISSAITVIGTFVSSIASALPQLLSVGMDLIANLVSGLIQNIPLIIQQAQQIINNFGSGLSAYMPNIISKGIEILTNLVSGIIQMLPTILQIATQVITGFITGLVSYLPQILQGGIQIIVMLVQGIISNLPNIIQSGIQIIGSLLSGIASSLPQIIAAGIQLIVQLAMALITGLPTIAQAGWDLITGLGAKMLEAIPAALEGVWNGIKEGFSSAFDWITGKSSESNAKVKADIDTTASTVTAKTAEIATQSSINMDIFKVGVTNATGQASAQAGVDATTLYTNVTGQTNALATQGSIDFLNFATSAGVNMANANLTATSEAQAMQTGVSEAVSGMNLDGVNQTLALANGIGQNISTASVNATAEAQAINSNISSNLQAAQGAGTTAFSGLNAGISSEMASATATAQSQSQALSTAITTGFNQAKTNATQSMNGIATSVTSGFNKINSTVTSGGNRIKSTFTSVFNSVKSATNSAMSNLNSSFSSGMSRAVSVAQSSGNRIVSIFRSLAGQMQAAGAYAGQGFASGLAGQAGYIYSIANSIANNVAATIRRAMDIHSPSRVTRELGAYTGEGFALGMQDWMSEINAIGREYANAVTDQRWATDAELATSASITSSGVSSSLDNLSEEVRNQELTDTVFEVHNEIVGDEIYTTIKEKEARERAKDDYFVYA